MKVQLLHKGLFVEVLVQPKFYLFHNLVGLQTCTLCISCIYKTPQLVTHEKVCWKNNSTVGEIQVDIWYHHCIRLATLLSQKDVDLDALFESGRILGDTQLRSLWIETFNKSIIIKSRIPKNPSSNVALAKMAPGAGTHPTLHVPAISWIPGSH